MGSTFGGLSTAYSGLVAARAGLDVVGQNIANATTDGYTRQRLTTSSVEAPARVGLFSGGVQAGRGVALETVARLGDLALDGRVRATAGAAGYQSTRSEALATLETSLGEPAGTGLSKALTSFWAGWSDLAAHPGEAAPAAVLLTRAGAVATTLADASRAVDAQWTTHRDRADGEASQLTQVARQIADLNVRIRDGLQQGVSVNELLDARGLLTEKVAGLAGGTVVDRPDGTVDVLLGGNALVRGDTARAVQVVGGRTLGETVTLEWADRPGQAVGVDAGTLAGRLSVLAPADASGAGGVLAEASASFDALARQVADQVNTVHRTGIAPDGGTGLDVFAVDPGVPAARGLRVVPTDASGLALAAPGAGALDGSVADRLAQLGTGSSSPDRAWAAVVTGLGAAAGAERERATLTDLAATSARARQQSVAGVDLDEENVALLTHQHAYQGAARVMTAIDEMLDTLINGMGRVGR